MKTIDLGKSRHTLSEVLALAEDEPVLLRTPTAGDFLVERPDDFDREVAELGASEQFMSFLAARAQETETVPHSEVRRRLNR